MACMEHQCYDCGHVWFDNSTINVCPECGGQASGWFDEEYDDH